MKISSYSCFAVLALVLAVATGLMGFVAAAGFEHRIWLIALGVLGISAAIAMSVCWWLHQHAFGAGPHTVYQDWDFEHSELEAESGLITLLEEGNPRGRGVVPDPEHTDTEHKPKEFDFPDIGRWG